MRLGRHGIRAIAVLVTCLLLTVTLFAGCGTKQAKHENTLTIAYTGDLDSAMWTQSGLFLIDQLLTIMGEPILFVQPDGTVQPGLADRWEASDDGLVYTFYLNPNAKWHDGQPVTAKDVAFTLEQTIYPETPSGGGPSLLLKGADDFAARKTDKVEGIEIIDDHTIRLTFASVSGQVLAVLAADAILPYHILGDVPVDKMAEHEFNTKPIYCGPYKMTSWTKGSEMVFERFDDFFGPKPAFEKIIYRIIPESATAIAELKAGTVDVIMNVPVDDYQSLVSTKGLAGIETTGPFGYHLLVNQNKPEWKNLKTRQALSHAIDWQAILNGPYKGKGVLSTSMFHPGNWEYNTNLQPYKYDVEAAKSLLAEVGWKDTDSDGIVEAHGVTGVKDGTKLTATLPVTKKESEDNSLIIKEQLKQVGIEATVEMYESSTFYADIYKANGTKWDMTLMQWGNSFVGAWPSSRGAEYNFGGVGTTQHKREGWDDKDLAQMIDDVMRIPDQSQAKPVWDEIQKRIFDNVYRIHAIRPNFFIVYNANLQVDASTKIWDLMWLKLSREAQWKTVK